MAGHAQAPSAAAYAGLTHPTCPESASAGRRRTRAAATAELLADWDAALPAHAALTPDTAVALVAYGEGFAPGEPRPIPERDLPPRLPAWMGLVAALGVATPHR